MKKQILFNPASQDELSLYCFMGEALCMIQELEEALSHAIILKKYSSASKKEADAALDKQRRSYTLGKAVKLAERENLFPPSLQSTLDSFFERRNWLVHKAMYESRNDLYTALAKDQLFQKIKSISRDAQRIQHDIELEMVNFCSSQGRDMSEVTALLETRYKKNSP